MAIQDKKRGAAQANKGRAVSIAQIWEYKEEGDFAAHNQGADFKSSFPKRRKLEPAKRIMSVPGYLQLFEQTKGQGSQVLAPLQDSKHDGNDRGSQLATPDSEKRGTEKAAPPNTKNTRFKPGPFRNPVITKPLVSREEDIPFAKPVTIHQGWTSTEEAVKSQNKGISKTTLDKLAAFRYRPPREAKSRVGSLFPTGNSQSNRTQQCSEDAEVRQPSADYGLIDNSISDRVYQASECLDPHEIVAEPELGQWQRDEHPGDDAFFNGASWDITLSNAGDEYPCVLQTNLFKVPAPSKPNHFPGEIDHIPNHHLRMSQKNSDCRESTSSESIALFGLAEATDASDQNSQGAQDVFPPIQDISNNDSCVLNPEQLPVIDVPRTGVKIQSDTALFSQFKGDDSNELPRYHTLAGVDQLVKSHRAGASEDVEVTPLDVVDIEVVSKGVSNEFVVDEFGGSQLDDADLLTIVSDPVVPETHPFVAVQKHHSNPGRNLYAPEPFKACSRGDHAVPSILPGVIDWDDEYPLEELEEEDMILLPEHFAGVIESFQAPQSLPYSFGDDPISGEIYDNSLQFSPLKSRISSLSQRNSENRTCIDISRQNQAGYTDVDTALLEHEDWSCIRSNEPNDSHATLISDPATESHTTSSVSRVTKRIIPLGPQSRHLWHDRPPLPNGMLANYKTTDLAESESRVFIGIQEDMMMARCIGRLKRDKKHATGWLIEIINIRPTDWEEIKWTKRIVSAGLFKSEKMDA
ncbi:hypothetical protein BUE80_DR013747 [Diplocarpon rosae]|nr:hypothetical protein BUE80_DR013747 [Diplocarpon rosae]